MTALIVNPYKAGPPVTGTDFYGRKDLLSKVRQALGSSNVVVLQGQRRIGKSSFLQKLPTFLSSETVGTGHAVPLLPVIFDIQRYVQDTLPQFQEHLAKTIAKELPISVPSLSEWESNSTLFRDVWLPQVFEYLGSHKLVIIVDEFDNLGEQQTGNKATEALVPFLNHLVTGEPQLKWVFTVGRHIGKLSIQYDPIVSQSVQFRISFLSLEETSQLIVEPASGILTFEPTAIERIYELTNGQPHLVQALCSEVLECVVFDEEREIATVEDVNAVVPHTLKAYQGAIASIARVPTLEERVLAAVAQLTAQRKTASRDEIIKLLLENRIQLERDELTDTLDSLLEWKLLVGDAQRVRVAIELVRLWITKNVSLEPSREQELNIHSALAHNRFEFAQKALQAGKYKMAIKDYKETLEHIPNHCEALRGLAEAYRLCDEVAGRAITLKNLYSYERNVLPELIEALTEYAERSEKEGNFSVAAQQYEILIKLQNRDCWQQGLTRNLEREFESCLEKVEKNLDLEETKQYSDSEWLPILQELQSTLVKVKQNIERKLAVDIESSQAEALKCFLNEREHREWLIHKRIQFINAKINKKSEEFVRLIIALEKCGYEFKKMEKKYIIKAVWDSPFYLKLIPTIFFPPVILLICYLLLAIFVILYFLLIPTLLFFVILVFVNFKFNFRNLLVKTNKLAKKSEKYFWEIFLEMAKLILRFKR